jgi:hypothetical protein
VVHEETALLMVHGQRFHVREMRELVLICLAGAPPVSKVEIVALAVREHLKEVAHLLAAIMPPGIVGIRRVSEWILRRLVPDLRFQPNASLAPGGS